MLSKCPFTWVTADSNKLPRAIYNGIKSDWFGPNFEIAEYNGSDRSERMGDLSYALAWRIIDEMWEIIQNSALTPSLQVIHNNLNFYEKLNLVYIAFLRQQQHSYVWRLSPKNDSERWWGSINKKLSEQQDIFMNYVDVTQHAYNTNDITVPSFTDLVTFVSGISEYIEKIFYAQNGRNISKNELQSILLHKKTMLIFLNMMTHTKQYVFTLLKYIAINIEAYNDDIIHFEPKYFTFNSDKEGTYITMNMQSFVADSDRTLGWFINVLDWQFSRSDAPKARKCPVLYTKEFAHIYEWFVWELVKQRFANYHQ